jgi:serine protease Do
MVSQTAPKTKTELKIIRDKKPKTITATLTELKEEGFARTGRRGPSAGESDALDGVVVADLDARTRRQMNIPSGVRGALVTEVDAESASAKSGLRVGDVILEINRRSVSNADEAVEISRETAGEETLLRIWRQGRSMFIGVKAAPKR